MISWLSLRHNRSRLYRWSAVFGGFAFVQLLVQGMNAVAGFLLVRTLEKPDYAWFTIASGMSAALATLADGGIGNAVTSIGGTVWQDKASLKGLVQAALRLRMKLALLASLIVAGISLHLLLRNGAGWPTALGLTVLVLAPIWQISNTAVLSVVNRLHSRTRQLQLADLLPALVRALLTVGLAVLGWLSPLTAFVAVAAAQLVHYAIVRAQVLPFLDIETEPVDFESHTRRIKKVLHQVFPNFVFTAIQGQLTTWLISVFATAREVADLGALNRLAVIFIVLGSPMAQFVFPAFARASSQARLWMIALALIAGCTAFSGILLGVAWWRSELFLWLLGGNYAHLHEELLLVILGMSIVSLTGLIWGLNSARGWLRGAWIHIPLTVTVQVIAAVLVPLDSVKGVAWFIIVTALAQLCQALVMCVIGLMRPGSMITADATA